MKLEKIITLSNKKMELRFLALVRSLRATGCNLPVWVIPYDNNLFELPENCIWWEVPEVISWLSTTTAPGTMRKYQCLLTTNYQFVDSDVVFVRNPETVLEPVSGFVTSCGHWHNPGETYTEESLGYFKIRSTTWQKEVFNTGQYACDLALYDFQKLKATAEDPRYRYTCLDFKFHEQPGINLLVHLSGSSINNITLPPYHMESTWAGDYTTADYERYWKEAHKKPYIIHWAGCNMSLNRPIDQLFLGHLTAKERGQWDAEVKGKMLLQNSFYKKLRRNLSRIKKSFVDLRLE